MADIASVRGTTQAAVRQFDDLIYEIHASGQRVSFVLVSCRTFVLDLNLPAPLVLDFGIWRSPASSWSTPATDNNSWFWTVAILNQDGEELLWLRYDYDMIETINEFYIIPSYGTTYTPSIEVDYDYGIRVIRQEVVKRLTNGQHITDGFVRIP